MRTDNIKMNKELLKKLNILYVEDDEAIRNNTIITLNLLQANIFDAIDGKDGLNKFIEHQDKIDIILTDLSMPSMSGLEMIEEIKKIRSDIPVIITTAHQESNYLKTAIRLGINYYILKPIEIYNMIETIVKAMEPVNLKKALVEKNEELMKLNASLEERIKERTKELEILASTDPLTQIHNRRKFFELSATRFRQNNDNLYAVMIDVDQFKDINDKYGHHTGDEILKHVTNAIKENLSSEDIFGRVGGEEFAIVYNSDDSSHINKIEKLRKVVENLSFNGIKVTISLGLTKKNQEDKNIDRLLSRADKALYEAKGAGRNKVIFREY
jgi:diguanylate cyclase (GGDEF)-like protein